MSEFKESHNLSKNADMAKYWVVIAIYYYYNIKQLFKRTIWKSW